MLNPVFYVSPLMKTGCNQRLRNSVSIKALVEMKGSKREPALPLCLVAAPRGKIAHLLGFVKSLSFDRLSIDGYLVVNCKSL